jgi:DNA-binding response OmpR family regulator
MVPLQKILVVDHVPAERARLREILGREYEVAGAGGSDEAMTRLGEGDIDLVLLGSMGEEADTEALLTSLCSCRRRPKVILLAPAFTDDVLDRAALLSADGVLKCSDEDEVAASVAAHLGI